MAQDIDQNILLDLGKRLSECEATNREQNARISTLIDTQKEFVAIIKEQMENEKDRADKLMKMIVILVGAVIVSTLGPKAGGKIAEIFTGGIAHTYTIEAAPWNDRGLFDFLKSHGAIIS